MKFFIAGAVSSVDDPFVWQETIASMDEFSDHEFVNAYESNDYDGDPYENPEKVMEPAVEEVRDADGLLVRWEDDAFLAGAIVYMREAHEHDIPIVVWYEGSRDTLQIPLEWMANATAEERDKAIKLLVTFAGDTSVITGGIQ